VTWSRRGLRYHLLFSRGSRKELVAAPRSLVVLLLVVSAATVASSRVVAFAGLVGLKSQGRRHGPHPVVGGVVRLSCWAMFGWWATVLVITAWRCCLVHAAWHSDGVWPSRETVVSSVLAGLVQRMCSC
jgi:hypothetical protein